MIGRGEGGKQPVPLDFPGFAQEFLRRSPAYRAYFRETAADLLRRPASLQEDMTRRWGLSYPLSPDMPAAAEPALWTPSASAFTTIVASTPVGSGIASSRIADWPAILVDRPLRGGRFLILDDKDGPHRIWLCSEGEGVPLAYVIPYDAAAELRLETARRLGRRLAGAPPVRALNGHRPSPFQRHRLGQLLAILDAVDPRGARPATTYEVARQIVYPAMTVGRGAEWKTSSERRHTQRLIDEARELRDGGYRRLLLGRVRGATKSGGSK
ncbi:DUF2285 domain-containing protein [Sphingopyxis sp.]|uniref:DUF2285 domain-containing protein n=1 Tax=Sphingopyxis sp. TaxID=1908224 RepID=UPI002D76C80F|nr:DUF2285 domain-containing protein [Sphingopyxis sp.]HET6523544.1 DUF2285 domain-containing protein [Sphingopyxis sp.]